MAVALYARKSIEREGSISCETQLDYCRAMLKPEERRQKIHTFVDNGYSGSNTDREGFREMMGLLNEKARKFAEEKRELAEKMEALQESENETAHAINLSKKWETADFEEKKSVCHLLIDKIYIAEDGAVEVVWEI